MASPDHSPPLIAPRDVARGAGLAALSRLGTLIEIVAQPVFTWLYGWATYGLYTVMWALVNIAENIVDLSMTQGLQREVPAASDEATAAALVRFALLVTVLPAALIAAAVSISASLVAPFFSAAPADLATLPATIALFAWALPLWTFIEVATSAVRARRAFGPEIRLRVFWEQLLRLLCAIALWAAGAGPMGLAMAHLLSLAATALLSARLLVRHYDRHGLLHGRLSAGARRNLLKSGLGTMPPALARRLFNDFPPVLLNLLLPGAAGATAAGYFGVARKIASVPLIVRQSFLYVLAPLATAQASDNRAAVAPLYGFSVRLSLVLAVPITALMMLIAPDILALFAPGAEAALTLLVLLLLARAGEAVVGPATPLVEMLGHRAMPLINTALGLALAAGLAVWLVPQAGPWGGATGMGIAVGAGVVAMAWVATVQLRVAEGLHLIDRAFLRAGGASLAALPLLFALSLLLQPLGRMVHAIGMVLLFWPVLWAVLRLGLAGADRAALGGLATKLRLI